MSSILIGAVEELTPDMVELLAIERLAYILLSNPEPILFDCAACGAERRFTFDDPGILMFRDFTCANIRTRCQEPARPPAQKRFYYYKPGSLVFALRGSEMWPGIIEEPPTVSERWVIHGKTPDHPKAYWVTFIHSKDADARWYGGYIKPNDIRPLEKPGNLPENFDSMPRSYRKAVLRAHEAVPDGLKERLLRFSFVAWAASQRNISTELFGQCSWQMQGMKRKDEGGASTSSTAPLKQQKVSKEALETTEGVKKSRIYHSRSVFLERPRGILSVFRSLKAGPPEAEEPESDSSD